MRYELQAVSFRDRLKISLRPVGVVGIVAILLTVVVQVLEPSIAETSFWMFLLMICLSAALEVYRALGPDHSGFVEITGASLTVGLNEQQEVFDLSTVTKAICFDILGNKCVILKAGNVQKDIVYSAYSNEMIHEFRRALGPRLKEGWFEWVKTWYEK